MSAIKVPVVSLLQQTKGKGWNIAINERTTALDIMKTVCNAIKCDLASVYLFSYNGKEELELDNNTLVYPIYCEWAQNQIKGRLLLKDCPSFESFVQAYVNTPNPTPTPQPTPTTQPNSYSQPTPTPQSNNSYSNPIQQNQYNNNNAGGSNLAPPVSHSHSQPHIPTSSFKPQLNTSNSVNIPSYSQPLSQTPSQYNQQPSYSQPPSQPNYTQQQNQYNPPTSQPTPFSANQSPPQTITTRTSQPPVTRSVAPSNEFSSEIGRGEIDVPLRDPLRQVGSGRGGGDPVIPMRQSAHRQFRPMSVSISKNNNIVPGFSVEKAREEADIAKSNNNFNDGMKRISLPGVSPIPNRIVNPRSNLSGAHSKFSSAVTLTSNTAPSNSYSSANPNSFAPTLSPPSAGQPSSNSSVAQTIAGLSLAQIQAKKKDLITKRDKIEQLKSAFTNQITHSKDQAEIAHLSSRIAQANQGLVTIEEQLNMLNQQEQQLSQPAPQQKISHSQSQPTSLSNLSSNNNNNANNQLVPSGKKVDYSLDLQQDIKKKSMFVPTIGIDDKINFPPQIKSQLALDYNKLRIGAAPLISSFSQLIILLNCKNQHVNYDLQEKAMKFLVNLAQLPENQPLLLQTEILNILIQFIDPKVNEVLLKLASWIIATLSQQEENKDLIIEAAGITSVIYYLKHSNHSTDNDVVFDQVIVILSNLLTSRKPKSKSLFREEKGLDLIGSLITSPLDNKVLGGLKILVILGLQPADKQLVISTPKAIARIIDLMNSVNVQHKKVSTVILSALSSLPEARKLIREENGIKSILTVLSSFASAALQSPAPPSPSDFVLIEKSILIITNLSLDEENLSILNKEDGVLTMIQLMKYNDEKIRAKALRCISHLILDEDILLQFIDKTGLDLLLLQLNNYKNYNNLSLTEEELLISTVSTLVNVTRSSSVVDQFVSQINDKKFIIHLSNLLKSNNFQLIDQSLCAITNITLFNVLDDHQIYDSKIIDIICDFLNINNIHIQNNPNNINHININNNIDEHKLEIQDRAAAVLVNLTKKNDKFRDYIREIKALSKIIELLNSPTISIQINIAKILTNVAMSGRIRYDLRDTQTLQTLNVLLSASSRNKELEDAIRKAINNLSFPTEDYSTQSNDVMAVNNNQISEDQNLNSFVENLIQIASENQARDQHIIHTSEPLSKDQVLRLTQSAIMLSKDHEDDEEDEDEAVLEKLKKIKQEEDRINAEREELVREEERIKVAEQQLASLSISQQIDFTPTVPPLGLNNVPKTIDDDFDDLLNSMMQPSLPPAIRNQIPVNPAVKPNTPSNNNNNPIVQKEEELLEERRRVLEEEKRKFEDEKQKFENERKQLEKRKKKRRKSIRKSRTNPPLQRIFTANTISPNSPLPKDSPTPRMVMDNEEMDDEKFEAYHQKRVKIAVEVLVTERSYIDSLTTMINKYMNPMLTNSKSKKPLITQFDIEEVFSNAEEIIQYHTMLLEGLERRVTKFHTSTCLGQFFVSMTDYFRCYTTYVNNYDNAIAVLSKNEERPDFKSFFEDLTEKGITGKGLYTYLIMPIQRIPRYILLLNELIKNTKPTHIDFEHLKAAVDKMSVLADFIDESKEVYNESKHLVDLQKRIISFPKDLTLVAANRILLRDAILFINQIKYHVFLFSDAMLITTPDNTPVNVRDKKSVNMANSQKKFVFVRFVSLLAAELFNYPDAKLAPNAFSIRSPEFSFSCNTDTPDEKLYWLTAFEKVKFQT